MTNRTFDQIYADVPAEQREELRQFRQQHPQQTATIDGVEWAYIDSGGDKPALLLLVGGLRMADAAYRNIPLLTDTFRVIAPSYPALDAMTALADGLAGLLRHLGLGRAHVLAGSFGGMLAQTFMQRYPVMLDRVVLSTTAVLDDDSTQRYRDALAMVEPVPEDQVLEMAKGMMFDIIAPSESMQAFYRAYLDELYSSRVDKRALVSTYRALLDFADNVTLDSAAFDAWDRRDDGLLILESDDDATFDEATRARVRARYPQAQSYVFHDAGHSPAVTQHDLYFRVVRHFLRDGAVGE